MLEQLLNHLERQEAGDKVEEAEGSGYEAKEEGESCHPMILSHMASPRVNQLALLRIRNAASELRQTQLDLVDYVEEQLMQQEGLRMQLVEDFCLLLAKVNASWMHSSRPREDIHLKRQLQTKENELRMSEAQVNRLQEALEYASKRTVQLQGENQALQEHIFDLEQRIAGVELEVERRVKERGRKAERQAAANAREQSKQIINQLKNELSSLRQNYALLEQERPSGLREREWQLAEAEKSISQRQEEFKQELSQLELVKQAAYHRQHELLAAEEVLSKKTSQLRKKEAELSEWEAELTRREHTLRSGRSETALLRHIPNEIPQGSLKSFGEADNASNSQHQQMNRYRFHTQDNEEDPPSSAREHQTRPKHRQWPVRDITTIKDSSFQRQAIQARRQNSQLNPRDASPYRLLADIKSRDNRLSRQETLLRGSSRALRERSASREHESELGSKLSRLRQEIKKQMQSIK